MLSRWTNNPNCLLSEISATAMLWHEQMALTYQSPRIGGTRDNRDSYTAVIRNHFFLFFFEFESNNVC
jgi:hypothetical protein